MAPRRVVLAGPVDAADRYFPVPDAQGGWRRPKDAADTRRKTGFDIRKLDEAFEFAKLTSKHGGLLVARHGWLVYENYFGRSHRYAMPNHASLGKSVTSVSVAILMSERPGLFPLGLDQQVFTPHYFPPEMFPLSDPRKAKIKLGQLLTMTAGIRGNNPGYVYGKQVTLDPAGPDGYESMLDDVAFGKTTGRLNTQILWCEPGEGYSYATSSIHLASVLLRHVTGRELEEYVREKIAVPLGWGRWGWGYKQSLQHSGGGGGVALRPPDLLRFAYLLLREGEWNGRQVVPRDYIRRCPRSSPYNPHYPYSLQFNVNDTSHWPRLPRDLFWKTGSGGHAIYIVPSLDLVVVKIGGRDDQYDPENTGIAPVPESVFRYDGSRESWKSGTTLPYEETYAEVLRFTLAALR